MRDRFYRYLGMLAWSGTKLFMRRKFGPPYGPKPVLAAATLALVGALVVVFDEPQALSPRTMAALARTRRREVSMARNPSAWGCCAEWQ